MPEKILLSSLDMSKPWGEWSERDAIEILWPENVWEGAVEPSKASARSTACVVVNQVRDPVICEENGEPFCFTLLLANVGSVLFSCILANSRLLPFYCCG